MRGEAICPFQQARSLRFIHQLHSVHLLQGSQPPQKGTKCNVQVPDLISSEETLPLAALAERSLQQGQPFSYLIYQRRSSLLIFSCYNVSHRRKPLRSQNFLEKLILHGFDIKGNSWPHHKRARPCSYELHITLSHDR
ncbi:hypothetical protein OIU84_018658 [Salix udensis]|uniref:Uncharacterized protein n=1 Tax=Salix udensis TaxID=889485 RepID=A0AAD6KX05_9ROSI|nr:hypothetical protein OIU84_018658 [Salix udensis]